MSALDAHLPDAAHREQHERFVAAPPERVWQALQTVTPAELLITGPLMALRSLPARLSGRPDPLGGPAGQPFIERFLDQGFFLLEQREPLALVAGGIGQPWRLAGGGFIELDEAAEFAAFDEPGFVRMAMSFELTPEGAGTRLRTETRVRATDAASAAAFRRYWLLIRPPSGLIRRDMLRAVARRAERSD